MGKTDGDWLGRDCSSMANLSVLKPAKSKFLSRDSIVTGKIETLALALISQVCRGCQPQSRNVALCVKAVHSLTAYSLAGLFVAGLKVVRMVRVVNSVLQPSQQQKCK